MFNQYHHYWLANTDTAALLLHQRHATEQCDAECVFFVLQKLGYFPLGCCPKLLTKKISPWQVDRVVNKTSHRRRRRSCLLTTPI